MRLYHDDCLEIMRDMPDDSVDIVLTDPPYMLNIKSSFGKTNSWADCCNAAFWYAEWIKQARRVLKSAGCLWSFLNWRSFVIFQKAAHNIRWSIESVLIWDKGCFGTGGMKGLRPSYELIALWAMPDFRIENRRLSDIQRFQWSSARPSGHPAKKPVELFKWIIENSTKTGDTVCDLFMGSGSTGVACVKTERDFIGIELDADYFQTAERRIEEAKHGI